MNPLVEALLLSAQDPMWIVGSDRTLVRCNAAFARLSEDLRGRAPRIGMSACELLDETWIELLEQTLAGRGGSIETSLVVRGVARPFAITGTPAVDSGAITHAVFAARNVRPANGRGPRARPRTGSGLARLLGRRRADDERRRLLDVIERKGLEWSLTFDAIELPIFITSLDGVVRRMNRSARDLAGGDYATALGRHVRSFGAYEPWTTLAACVEAVRDSGENCTAQAYDGESDRSWEIAANSYRPAEEPPRVILIARETTNVVRLQDAVKRGEQLSALGELVAGVAHEVRNPLFGMLITLDSLEAAIPRDADVDDLFAVLRRWLDRLNRLMESLLAYGRTWTVDLQPGSIADVLQRVIDETAAIAKTARVDVRTAVDATRPMLMDPTRLAQAFENLVTNAIQHTCEEGVVELTAREADGHIECSVRDHGPGFAPEDLPRIFEPFFTRRSGGTGLGLAIVQRIVDEHGGTLHAGNAEDGGAIVTVRFPVYQSAGV